MLDFKVKTRASKETTWSSEQQQHNNFAVWCPSQDDSKALRDYNITANSRVLITKGAAAQAALSEQAARVSSEEARAAHLDRLKATLDKMASRDGRGLTDKWEFSLENQVLLGDDPSHIFA